MNDLSKDIATGTLFIVGFFSFISGLFVFSAAAFAAASLFSNMSSKVEAHG
jgi:hypothetical protein